MSPRSTLRPQQLPALMSAPIAPLGHAVTFPGASGTRGGAPGAETREGKSVSKPIPDWRRAGPLADTLAVQRLYESLAGRCKQANLARDYALLARLCGERASLALRLHRAACDEAHAGYATHDTLRAERAAHYVTHWYTLAQRAARNRDAALVLADRATGAPVDERHPMPTPADELAHVCATGTLTPHLRANAAATLALRAGISGACAQATTQAQAQVCATSTAARKSA